MTWLFQCARSQIGRLITGWIFAHMSFAIPVQRLRETETLIAFRHPRPSYPFHILLVPKRSIASLSDLAPSDSDFVVELFQTVSSLVQQFDLDRAGYRLIANGGKYQDIAQLHFHLVSEAQLAKDSHHSRDRAADH